MKKHLSKILSAFFIVLYIIVIFNGCVTDIKSNNNSDTLSYTSTAKYMIRKLNYNDNNALTGLTHIEVDAMHIMVANASEMIDNANFARSVNEKLVKYFGITDYSDSQIRAMMSIELVSSDSTCCYFSVTSPNPEHSYAIASIAGDILVEELRNNTAYAVIIYKIDGPCVPSEPSKMK